MEHLRFGDVERKTSCSAAARPRGRQTLLTRRQDSSTPRPDSVVIEDTARTESLPAENGSVEAARRGEQPGSRGNDPRVG